MAGGVRASPERSENAAPWRGHSMRSPSTQPPESDSSAWVQTSWTARTSPSTLTTQTGVSSTSTRCGSPVGEVLERDGVHGGQPSFSRTAVSSSARSSSRVTCARTSCRKPITISRLATASGTPRERR